MTNPTRRRATGFTAAIAIVAALLSPLVAVSAANAAEITGTSPNNATYPWQDLTLNADIVVGYAYSSTVRAPAGYAPYSMSSWDVPNGLNVSINSSSGVITLSGTPTTADANDRIWFAVVGSDNTPFSLEFEDVVVSLPLTATTTTVSGTAIQSASAVSVSAIVSPAVATGTVTFRLGSTVIATAPVSSGIATYTGPITNAVLGTNTVLSATYSGDSSFATSTSTSTDTVAIYGDRSLYGALTRNGEAVVGEVVELRTGGGTSTGFSDTTDSSGNFEIDLGTPTTAAEVTAQYRLYATASGVYYASTAGPGTPNVTDLADASTLIQSNWTPALNLYVSVPPTWTDETLGQPRLGVAYNDGVAATTIGAATTISYSLSGDPLPSWLQFTDGSFTSTNPTDQLAHTFTVTAISSYGAISKQFTLQAGNAAVAPTFTDTTVADLQVGTALTDAIAATGDATIVYSSTPLPAGLTLNPATGALTGIPTVAGDFMVTFTASNGTAPDATFLWEPTIAAAPDLELVLNFGPGTTVGNATTDIGASGLQVGSTYTLTMFSTPRILYTGTIDATGAFLHTITLPADTPVGAHELVLTGVAPDGTVLTARAWFTLLSNGSIGAISYAGPLSFTLAATGSDPLLPIGIAGGLMLAGYLLVMRRRTAAVRVP